MFTGIVQATGTVLSIKPTAGAVRITVAAPQFAGQWNVGDSIAVNGTCLTALEVADISEPHPGRFAADLAAETLARTTLGELQPGSLVNLEFPTQAGAPLGGHVVQGHVDGTATLVSLVPLHPADLDQTDWRLTLDLPHSLAHQVISQGSITVDGISLTVAAIHDEPNVFIVEIAVIPHTYRATNLRTLLSGAKVNIETDVLSKYSERRALFGLESTPASNAEPTPITVPYLLANGY
ncbi:MAG: riboflavin synthase [Acidobacteriota bacterium]